MPHQFDHLTSFNFSRSLSAQAPPTLRVKTSWPKAPAMTFNKFRINVKGGVSSEAALLRSLASRWRRSGKNKRSFSFPLYHQHQPFKKAWNMPVRCVRVHMSRIFYFKPWHTFDAVLFKPARRFNIQCPLLSPSQIERIARPTHCLDKQEFHLIRTDSSTQ